MDSFYKNKCMMIHPGRVGSTVVVESLSECPIYLGGEIYNKAVNNISNWESKWNYVDLFDHMMLSSLKAPMSPYGRTLKFPTEQSTYLFEYKPFHASSLPPIEEAVSDFEHHGVTHYIFLYRKNYLRRYVSYLVSVSNGIWHTAISPDKPHKIVIDVNACSDWDIGFRGGNLLDAIDHYYNSFVPSVISSIQKRNHLLLAYEDHVQQDPNVAFKLITELLGVSNDLKPIDRGYRKQNDFPLREIIENYDQVAAMLSPSGYQHLLL